MSVTVKKIAANGEDFERFWAFRSILYPQTSPIHFVKEDFNFTNLLALFLLEENGEIVARFALYQNQALSWEGKTAVTIGNYEAFDRPKDIRLLFKAVEQEAGKLGVDAVIGPMNGSTWFSYRLTENTQDPFLFEPIHHNYYHDHFLDNGFKNIAKYFSSKVPEIPEDDGYFTQLRNQFEKEKNIKFRNIDLSHYEEELEAVFPFLEESFKHNFLFTPISKKEFISKYLAVKSIINPNFTFLAEDLQGNIIGCIFCVDDHLNPHEKVLIIKTIARAPDPKWKDMGQVIGSIIYQKAKDEGYDAIVHALMEEGAHSSSISQKFAGKPINYYHLYGKNLVLK